MCQMRFPRPSVSLRLEAPLTSADAFRFEAKVSSGRFTRVPSHVKPYGILTQWHHTAAGQIVGLFISWVLLQLNSVFKRGSVRNKASPDGWRASLSPTIGSSTERSCDPVTTQRQTSDTHTRVHHMTQKKRTGWLYINSHHSAWPLLLVIGESVCAVAEQQAHSVGEYWFFFSSFPLDNKAWPTWALALVRSLPFTSVCLCTSLAHTSKC